MDLDVFFEVGGEIGKDPKFVGSVSSSIGLTLGVTTAF